MPTKRYRVGRAPVIEDVPPWFLERFLTWGERPSSDEWQVDIEDRPEWLGGFAWWSMGYLVHADEVERARRIWDAVKPDLLRRWRREYPGTRPWAWWHFESPELCRPGESEPACLSRLGLLTAAERRRLTPADFELVPLDDDQDDDDDEATSP
jgi:hypothetical protein